MRRRRRRGERGDGNGEGTDTQEGGGARRGLLERWKLKIQNGRYFRPTGPKQKVARRSLWHASLYARCVLWFALCFVAERNVWVSAKTRARRGERRLSMCAHVHPRTCICTRDLRIYVFQIISNRRGGINMGAHWYIYIYRVHRRVYLTRENTTKFFSKNVSVRAVYTR